jgi:hypothetical protein
MPPHDGIFDLRIPGLHVSRFSRINEECVHALHLPSLCIIAQGEKTVTVGQEVYEYDTSRMLVFSVALPVAAQVTRASHSEPYLALKLDFDPTQDCRPCLEGISARSASHSRAKGRLRSSARCEHCQRGDQVSGVPGAARRH